MQIRNLARAEGRAGRPSWTAELVEGDAQLHVDRHDGSWMVRTPGGQSAHVSYEWAARLQAKVRPLEKAEAKTPEPEPVPA